MSIFIGHYIGKRTVIGSRDIIICLLRDAKLSDQLMACYQAELLEFIHWCRKSEVSWFYFISLFIIMFIIPPAFMLRGI